MTGTHGGVDEPEVLAGVEQIVGEVRRRHPDALAALTRLREDMMARGQMWPDWCWMPMSGVAGYVVAGRGDPADIAVVAAITAWRSDRAVLRLSPPPVLEALAELEAADLEQPQAWRDIPLPRLRDRLLVGLPVWCPYLLMPPVPQPLGRGLWVHLEHDDATGRPELRILLDVDGRRSGLMPLVIYLDRPTLGRALDDMLATTRATLQGRRGADLAGLPDPVGSLPGVLVHGVLPLILGAIDPGYRYLDQTTGQALVASRPGGRPPRETTMWTQTPLGIRGPLQAN